MRSEITSGNSTIKISEDVIITCIANAALATKGLAGLSGASPKKGVKLSKEEEKLVVDLYVILNYGVKIPEVAWNIQKNVKKELEKIITREIKAINIHVQSIYFKEQEVSDESQ